MAAEDIQQKLLAGIERIFNGVLLLDQEVLGSLAGMADKMIKIDILNTDIDIFIVPLVDKFLLSLHHQAEADVVIKATPATLLGMLISKDTKIGDMQIIGDVGLAQSFQAMLRNIDIDWEEYLSQLIGDIGAHKVSNIVRSMYRLLRSSGQTIAADVREYLYYEKKVLAEQTELDIFYHAVDALRNDVERLQKRIQRLG